MIHRNEQYLIMVVKFNVVHKLIRFYVVREKKSFVLMRCFFIRILLFVVKKEKRICTVYEIDMFFKNKLIPIRMNKKIFRISFFGILKKR
jgi:hypothetical protein